MKTDVSKFKDETLENIYNTAIKDDSLKKEIGLTPDIIKSISKEKNEPQWILDLRLKALDLFYKLPMPTWGPDISYLDLSKIATYVKPKSKMNMSWEDVPEDIRNNPNDVLNYLQKTRGNKLMQDIQRISVMNGRR